MNQVSQSGSSLCWPGSTVGPTGQENILIGFHGLFCFAYNENSKMCEVGTHSQAPLHRFSLHVYELSRDLPNPKPPLIYRFEPPSHEEAGGILNVDIEGSLESGVKFFLPATKSDADWSRVVDFEVLHPNGSLPKKRGIQKPKVNIFNGLFFVWPTNFDFQLIEEGQPRSEGKIAFLAIAAVNQHPDSSEVLITSALPTHKLVRAKDKILFLLFRNVCPKDTVGCDPLKSDFDEHYDLFELPPDAKKFDLKKKQGTGARPRTRFPVLEPIIDELGILSELFSSQDAPCTVGGFGQSPGGTEQPPA